MYTKTVAIAIFVIAATMAIATAALSIATPAFADKDSGQQGVDKADQHIHDNDNALEHADEGFHKGTCSGGFGAGGFPC
jgi:hypothetical protein